MSVLVAPGTTSGTVAVATPSGTALGAKPFGIVPSIASLTPATGPAGTSVTITGSGFVGATAVKIGSAAAQTFTVDSDTQITAVVAAGAKSGRVSVTTPGGTAAGVTPFTVVAVTSFSPQQGGPGTKVTISGSGFTGATGVQFNGVDATNVIVVSATKVTAVVAAGATTGPISVVTPNGVAASAQPFTRT